MWLKAICLSNGCKTAGNDCSTCALRAGATNGRIFRSKIIDRQTANVSESHSWDTVVTAAWRKYPNPHNPSVVGLDVLDRNIDKEGRLRTHRLMATSWGFPSWVTKLIGLQEVCHASEHSVVDPEKKTFTLKTRNVSLANVLAVDEQLVYTQHPTDPERTLLRQEATVTVSGLPLCSKLEQMMTDAMSSNANKGRQAMEWVIEKVKKEAKELTVEAHKCMDNVLPKSL